MVFEQDAPAFHLYCEAVAEGQDVVEPHHESGLFDLVGREIGTQFRVRGLFGDFPLVPVILLPEQLPIILGQLLNEGLPHHTIIFAGIIGGAVEGLFNDIHFEAEFRGRRLLFSRGIPKQAQLQACAGTDRVRTEGEMRVVALPRVGADGEFDPDLRGGVLVGQLQHGLDSSSCFLRPLPAGFPLLQDFRDLLLDMPTGVMSVVTTLQEIVIDRLGVAPGYTLLLTHFPDFLGIDCVFSRAATSKFHGWGNMIE